MAHMYINMLLEHLNLNTQAVVGALSGCQASL